MESYNEYSATERLSKLRAMNRLLASGELAPAVGPCDLCGDSDASVKFEYHDEDYGAPPIWGKPAQYCLCLHCHRFKLHKRFVEECQVQRSGSRS
ncbi:hypothetical protein SAMN05444679_103104 [Variovorax sp. CF079]|nr:hypothetical protein SAMN05444679_103104 [Variovorax sp. CF079]